MQAGNTVHEIDPGGDVRFEDAERHRVRAKRSRISAAVAVSPSLGKMRSTLLPCAAGSRSVMASVARTTR